MSPEYFFVRESKYSKTNKVMSKGYRSQLGNVPTDQIWHEFALGILSVLK